jgi:stage II sporulation protein R
MWKLVQKNKLGLRARRASNLQAVWSGTIAVGLALAVGIAVAVIFSILCRSDEKDPLQPQIAGKVLRFHVLANSDSDADQDIKLQVRDAIGTYMESCLAEAADLDDTRRIVEENLENITTIAEETLKKNGVSYGATAHLEYTQFPEKTYGAFTFPSGEYEALRVVLGEGAGHNWWCVLYPNLCFSGSMYEVKDEEAGEALREVLSPEEYADVLGSGKFRIRLKFLEYFRANM